MCQQVGALADGHARIDPGDRRIRVRTIVSTHDLGPKMFVQVTNDERIRIWAPAKLNLFLEILHQRVDQYHELETLMVPVDTYDEVVFHPHPAAATAIQPRPIQFSLHHAEPTSRLSLDIPAGGENLALRALERLREATGCRSGGRLQLFKRIPSQSGLGGGSADAAAALWAGNLGWKLHLSRAELSRLAAELGSDVPFFLAGQTAICRGRGEEVTPLNHNTPLHFVVVRPPVGISTGRLFSELQMSSGQRFANSSRERLVTLIESLVRGGICQLGNLLFNRLQESATRMSPWIQRLDRALRNNNVLGSAMTGSGSACYGLCHSVRHARQVASRIRSLDIGTAWATSTWGSLQRPLGATQSQGV